MYCPYMENKEQSLREGVTDVVADSSPLDVFKPTCWVGIVFFVYFDNKTKFLIRNFVFPSLSYSCIFLFYWSTHYYVYQI